MMPLVRRSLAVMVAALLAGVFAVAGTSAPANAAPKGSLSIGLVTDTAQPELGLIVQKRSFDVEVKVLDNAGQLTTVSKATDIVLEKVPGTPDPPGTLEGTRTATILRNDSGVTISGAIYSTYANDVKLRVRVTSGVDLQPDEVVEDIAATAVTAVGEPQTALTLTDPNCTTPTPELPTCGSQLILPKGATDRVVMSAGSCEGLRPPGLRQCLAVGSTKALVVTADLEVDGLYVDKTQPATLVLACDKVLCGQSGAGVPQLKVVYSLDKDSTLTLTADACPAKGVLGDKAVCADYVQSFRNQGDLYIYILFDRDPRFSYP